MSRVVFEVSKSDVFGHLLFSELRGNVSGFCFGFSPWYAVILGNRPEGGKPAERMMGGQWDAGEVREIP